MRKVRTLPQVSAELDELRERIEDLEDLRDLRDAVRRNRGKALLPWPRLDERPKRAAGPQEPE
jgi:hypothetical protein